MKYKKRFYPVQVTLKLKSIMRKGLYKWHYHLWDETKCSTTREIRYYCIDVESAAISFKKSEVERIVIKVNY